MLLKGSLKVQRCKGLHRQLVVQGKTQPPPRSSLIRYLRLYDLEGGGVVRSVVITRVGTVINFHHSEKNKEKGKPNYGGESAA